MSDRLRALIETMKTALFCLVMVMAARPAWAGYCDEDGAKATIQELEAYAKKKRKEVPQLDDICMDAVRDLPKLMKRTIAACTKVLEREPEFGACVEWSAKYGAKQLGTIDLFERTGATHPIEPFTYDSQAMHIYNALGDARAVPLVLEAWKVALADKRSTQERHAHTFRVWRHAAIKIFAKLGGAGERAFLEEQAKTIKDQGLLKAIKKANAEIEQRAAAPATPAAPAKPATPAKP